MLVLRDPYSITHICDPKLRQLVEQRFADICNGDNYDEELHGLMIVVEPTDSIEAIEDTSGCPILSCPFKDARYVDGHPELTHLTG